MKRWQKIAGGVAGLALLGGGVSYAAIPDSDDGEFHACVTNGASNGQHTVKILDQGGTCDAYSTEKVWNATGPQGPIGPQGAQGADGEDGVDTSFYEDLRTFSAPAGQVVDGSSYCNTGDKAISAAFQVYEWPTGDTQLQAEKDMEVVSSYIPFVGANSWVVKYHNTGDYPHQFQVRVFCAHLS